MDFAPYQDESPELERTKSPPRRTSIGSPPIRSPPPGLRPTSPFRAIPEAQPLPPPEAFANDVPSNQAFMSSEERARSLEAFQTSLPVRLDMEACLAYLLLPPAGGVLLLIFEHKSDYVRFHAWQSSMLFTVVFLVHLLLAWNAVLSWLMFGLDLALIGFLTLHAYRDVETLDHYEVPIFGRLANSFVDDE